MITRRSMFGFIPAVAAAVPVSNALHLLTPANPNPLITTCNHPKALWPGVKKWFPEKYGNLQVFDDGSEHYSREMVELSDG